MKRWLYIIIVVIFLIISGFLSYYFYQIKNKSLEEIIHGPCLLDGEVADYEIIKKKSEVSLANVFIKDKNSKKILFKFQIELPIPNHYHPIELHQCGVYTTRDFNYDYIKKRATPDYKFELWKYNYNRNGEPLIFLSGPISGSLFGTDFRIAPNEKYIVLEKGYLGKEDYSLVIKDLNTKKDVFVLSAKSIRKQYPDVVGSFNMREWSKDNRYFWGHISDGAYVLAYFRIDANNWKVDIFEAPEGVGGGDALNIEKGLVTRHPGYVWTGLDILTEEIKREWREQGKKSKLHLYNLFTKEQILLETIDEPLWYFKPKWLSDTELGYIMPSGERKVYKIEK